MAHDTALAFAVVFPLISVLGTMVFLTVQITKHQLRARKAIKIAEEYLDSLGDMTKNIEKAHECSNDLELLLFWNQGKSEFEQFMRKYSIKEA